MTDEQRRLEIAILVCPDYMPVDVIGLHTVLGMLPGVNVHLVWKNLDEISGFPRFPTRATTTFEDCPADLDVLCAGAVPAEVLEDAETLAFLADRGSRAKWIAGVCAGSLLMGAAGLLRGYRATTNLHVYDLLPYYGATAVSTNAVVEDRNRITAGPVTGSIEIALRLVQDLLGTETARAAELNMEYAPTPLFGVGTPELAGPELTRTVLGMTAGMKTPFLKVSERAAERLGVTVQSA
ncbi:isonitrile hydratase [Streptomyces sp. CB02923]|uniref:DJ-1/PfpI family protein n=1 Tax=Streptomyces sp. CB02923 TaxID=1718985 RepID=UPI00093D913A|nr:DJ-1/PfpI family protein [Streptomyces sp. CB02923]OKI10003.1 isonitrile hydratase [Streptomyces sp. CB02923]